MKVKQRVVTTYICNKCKTPYSSKKACAKCESLGVEPAMAKVGDQVQIKEKRTCLLTNKPYIAKGTITKISGLIPPDMEYELKWLGGKSERLDSHVRSYLVAYKCPRCGESREQPVFAPEFVITNTKKKAATNKSSKKRTKKG